MVLPSNAEQKMSMEWFQELSSAWLLAEHCASDTFYHELALLVSLQYL